MGQGQIGGELYGESLGPGVPDALAGKVVKVGGTVNGEGALRRLHGAERNDEQQGAEQRRRAFEIGVLHGLDTSLGADWDGVSG